MRWMQGGLPVLGERTTVRWLGSTAVEMVIRDGKAPFAGVTLVIFLEPRDVPWMWALGRSRGRRDTLIIRGVLRRAPEVELEALDPASWSGRDALRRVPPEWPVRQAAAAGGVVVHHASAAALAQRRRAAGAGPARRAGGEAAVRAPHRAEFPASRLPPRSAAARARLLRSRACPRRTRARLTRSGSAYSAGTPDAGPAARASRGNGR